jgi:hypothetical protein
MMHVLIDTKQALRWDMKYLLGRINTFDGTAAMAHRKVLCDAVLELGGESICELGCGRGVNLYLLSQRGLADLCGIERSVFAVYQGRAEMRKRNAAVKLFQGTLPQKADIVMADGLLMYIRPGRVREIIETMFAAARKAVVISAWHGEDQQLSEFEWVHDYAKLLPSNSDFRPYPNGTWLEPRWKKYGMITITRNQSCADDPLIARSFI